MDRNTIKQVILLVISSAVLYLSGLYLMSIGNLKSIFDGIIVMIFFFAVFPFISILSILSIKAIKAFINIKAFIKN